MAACRLCRRPGWVVARSVLWRGGGAAAAAAGVVRVAGADGERGELARALSAR